MELAAPPLSCPPAPYVTSMGQDSKRADTLRGAFGIPTQVGGVPTTQVALSMVECDVLQQASDLLSTELQTPGVQRAQDLLQHVMDCAYDGGYSGAKAKKE